MMAEIVHAMRTAEEGGWSVRWAFEWPGRCDGWSDPAMVPLLDYIPDGVRFDECAYGLTGEVGGFRKPVRKPWKVRANEVRLGALLRRCPGHAEHHECRGEMAKMSELYTEPLVERIGQLVTGRASSDTVLFPVGGDAG